MIVDNELKEIFSNPNKNIENMSKTELLLLKNEMIRNPNNYGLIEKSFEKTSTIHNLKLSDVRNPTWFHNNTTFESNIWMVKLNKVILTINFDKIKIDNNTLLTERPEILNTFKFWLCIQSHPIYNEGFLLKIIVNPDLSGFKLSVTDKSGLRNVDIFKNANEMIQNKFYFQMDALVDRGVFTKSEI